MPIFLYSNPNKPDEIIEVIQSVHEKHEYIKHGIKWDRVWVNPQVAIDSKWDANSSEDFIRKSAFFNLINSIFFILSI